jgi:serine protease
LGLAEVLAPSDANGNLALEPDELFSLNLKVRNYAFGVSSNNVTYTLSCSDPFLIILNNTHYGSLPADGYDVLSGAFQCRVAANATTKAVTCTLTVSADVPVVVGSTFTFSVLLNAGGIFVWEGKQEAGYSGRTIRNLLQAQGHSVYYTTVFPYSLRSFSAVFLSFGMATALSNNVTRFDRMVMYNAVKEYLELGGKLYLEGNDAVGFDLGYYLPDVGGGQSAADALWPLLGIADADDGSYNAIDLLTGFGPACTDDISFTASTQTKLDFMDRYVPASSAAAAFYESDYGIVAVQNYGQYGQKSFVFSYCLAELADGTVPNTKSVLLSRIMQDFSSPTNTLELVVPDVVIEKTVSSVSLSWQAVPHAVRYRIEASDEAEQAFIGIAATEQLSWNEDGVMPKRFYRVIAVSFGSD